MRIGWLDGAAGVAGDMWVGAALDAGLSLECLRPAIESMELSGVTVRAERVMRAGLAGTHFQVLIAPDTPRPHRHLADVHAVLDRADVPDDVRAAAKGAFGRLAEAEARAHQQSIESVHFHEVGAEDAIIDILCACLAMHELGVEALYASAVTTGTGTVQCEHGVLPVPAPGALGSLLGIPLRSGGPPFECVTPTGAALLAQLVDDFEPAIEWTPDRIGYGAGTRDPEGHPNLLRLTLGEARAAGAARSLWEVSCDLDTASGELVSHLIDGALARGAADCVATSTHMKKGRPGVRLTALVDDARRAALVEFVLEESSSLGLRMHRVQREVLERWAERVETPFGAVLCKAWRTPSGTLRRRPEDDEIRRVCAEHACSRQAVIDAVLRAPSPG